MKMKCIGLLIAPLVLATTLRAFSMEQIHLTSTLKASCSAPSDQRTAFQIKAELPIEVIFLLGKEGKFSHQAISVDGEYFGTANPNSAIATAISATISSGIVDRSPEYSFRWSWLTRYDGSAHLRIVANEKEFCENKIPIKLVYLLVDANEAPLATLIIHAVAGSENKTALSSTERTKVLRMINLRYLNSLRTFMSPDFPWFSELNKAQKPRLSESELETRRGLSVFFSAVNPELLIASQDATSLLESWPLQISFVSPKDAYDYYGIRIFYGEKDYLQLKQDGDQLALTDVVLDLKRLIVSR